MTEKDLHEALINYYEFQMGRLPYREELKSAVQELFSRDDLRFFFLLPFTGTMPEEKVEKKLAKANLPTEYLRHSIDRLAPEGLIETYPTPEGRVYGRANFIALIELQVRLKEASPLRAFSSRVVNDYIEGNASPFPTKTPYYRVIPLQATLTKTGQGKEISVGTVVPDPREILPIDIVSEMIKKEPLIALTNCYCRSTKELLDEGCGHPLETCFFFNELALPNLATGYSREVKYDEAMQIIWDCEKAGLVHSISNAEGHIHTLCNCCGCSCALMRGIDRGQTNLAAPSRYNSTLIQEKCTFCGDCVEVCPVKAISLNGNAIEFNSEKCVGCGHCVSICPEEALYLSVRKKPQKIFKNQDALLRRLSLESMVSLVSRKLGGG